MEKDYLWLYAYISSAGIMVYGSISLVIYAIKNLPIWLIIPTCIGVGLALFGESAILHVFNEATAPNYHKKKG